MQDVADALELSGEVETCADGDRSAMRDALRRVTESLNEATTPFAARRMDARVREALSGQRLDRLAQTLGADPEAPRGASVAA